MSIETISSVAASALEGAANPDAAASANLAVSDAAATDGISFDSVLNGIESLNQQLVQGQDAVHAMALGQVENLHQTMMASEQTRLAFDLMLQVRSKLLDAYQELLRMQV